MIVNDKSINVTKEIIERDCLSVLHKLHDQLNGLQLVQVVVQPLARLFNPALSTSSTSAATSTYMMSPDTAQALIARLDTDRDVNWLMEIIGYGLSVPFSLTQEHDCVKDCCTIYCEWLSSSLLPYNETNEDDKYQQLSKLVPVPIRSDPNRYARKMLSHLYNVFLPRQPVTLPSSNQKQQEQMADTNLAVVSRQAVLCHRVLRTIESIAHNPTNLMDHETWHHLLALLLTVNDKLLSPPTEPDDIGTQLNDRTLGTLFNLMLLACSKSIPDSNTWKTFHQMCLNWRHRPALIDHWKRLILMLTQRIVQFSSRSNKMCPSEIDPMAFHCDQPSNNAIYSSIKSSIEEMSYETLSQTWYWFLHLIGNPVELSEPSIISRTEEFYQAACSSNNVLDPRQHPCLNVLPQVFLNSMLGIRDVVDCFLGIYQPNQQDQEKDRHPMEAHTPDKPHVPVTTPTQARRAGGIKSLGIKSARSSTSGPSESHGYMTNPSIDSPSIDQSRSGSMSSSSRQTTFTQPRPSITSITSRSTLSETQQQYQHLKQKLSPERPKCNSLLHILGNWLFNAALIGSELNEERTHRDSNEEVTDESMTSAVSTSTATEVGSTSRGHSPALSRKHSSQQSQSSHTSSSMLGHQSAKQHDTSGSSGGWITLDPPLSADSFEQGQAEAMAIMCKIFSSKRSNEDISRGHLARFYLSLQHCLTFATGLHQTRPPHQSYPIKRQLLASVLNSSTSLLQSDLDGINLLIPHILRAIEFVFECGDREPIQAPPRQYNKQGSTRHSQTTNLVQNQELRRSCICTLVNLLAYPFHFQDLAIRDCLNETSPSITFGSLRNRLFKLLFVALQTENDQTNMQILFGGLSLAVHDLSCNAKPSSKSNDDHKSGGDTTNSLTQKVDATNQKSFVFSSKEGFLTKSLHVTCHLLISTWKHDNLVSLAALELLATIARVSSQPLDKDGKSTILSSKEYPQIEMKNEYMQTTKWICDYICNQCSRPPPAHSRDMHSTIVAAYQCLAVWFYNHPYLLNDENSVQTVLEVIELGVSGQKSKTMNFDPSTGVTSHTVISKGEKEMRPSSLRVRDAAESLMNVCMTCTSGAGSTYELQETGIVELLFSGTKFKTITRNILDPELRQIEAYRMFKYFSDDDSVIFSLFEGQEAPYKDSLICLLRTPFGRHCWRMKFNHYSNKCKNKIIANKTLGLIKRPFQQCSTPCTDGKSFSFPKGHNKSLYFNNSARFFPESLDHVQSTTLDKQVTTLNEYIQETSRNNSRFKADFDKINKIFSHQVMAEQKVMNECSSRLKRIDCEEPQQLADLETARVLVAHLGLRISLSSLIAGEKISPGFVRDLKQLDELPVNICDNINVFYVRRNKSTLPEILESVLERHNVTLEFFEWLLELGRPILMSDLAKGSASNDVSASSDKSSRVTRNELLMSDHGGAVFDGKRMILHWNEMCQELKIIAPSKVGEIDSNIMVFWLESQDDIANIPFEALSATLSQPEATHQEYHLNTTSAINPNSSNNSSDNSPTVVPTSRRPSNVTNKSRGEFARYFISPMRNGLYCVNLITSLGRQWLALPLVDEMTVNKAMLSSLIRESILNFCRRKRLDADSYQPPHVRRRYKLQDICSHYGILSRQEPSGFYNNLFRNIKNHSSPALAIN